MSLTARLSSALLLCSLLCFLAVSAQDSDDLVYPQMTEDHCDSLPTLICVVGPTAGNSASGVVTFAPKWDLKDPDDAADGDKSCFTHVLANLTDLTPDHEHAFHIHTYGDISDTSGSSTGGHFSNPAGEVKDHGYPHDGMRHWGDFGNLTTTADGSVVYEFVDRVIRLGGILGRGITVHADADQGAASQPSGGAGSRVAFGVIGYKQPAEK